MARFGAMMADAGVTGVLPADTTACFAGSAAPVTAAAAAAAAAAALMLSPPLAAKISISLICSCRISSLESGMRYFRTSVSAYAIRACASAGGAKAVIST